MKFFVLGLCLAIIPAFATTSACPQMQSSMVGCATFDSMLTSMAGSDSSDNVYVPGSSDFAASLMSPAPAIQPAAPQANVSQSNSTDALALFQSAYSSQPVSMYNPVAPPSSQSLSSLAFTASPTVYSTASPSSLASAFASGQISLAQLVMPTQYLYSEGLIQAQSNPWDPIAPFDPLDPDLASPETGSIVMIGSGFPSLPKLARRRRARARRFSLELKS